MSKISLLKNFVPPNPQEIFVQIQSDSNNQRPDVEEEVHAEPVQFPAAETSWLTSPPVQKNAETVSKNKTVKSLDDSWLTDDTVYPEGWRYKSYSNGSKD